MDASPYCNYQTVACHITDQTIFQYLTIGVLADFQLVHLTAKLLGGSGYHEDTQTNSCELQPPPLMPWNIPTPAKREGITPRVDTS